MSIRFLLFDVFFPVYAMTCCLSSLWYMMQRYRSMSVCSCATVIDEIIIFISFSSYLNNRNRNKKKTRTYRTQSKDISGFFSEAIFCSISSVCFLLHSRWHKQSVFVWKRFFSHESLFCCYYIGTKLTQKKNWNRKNITSFLLTRISFSYRLTRQDNETDLICKRWSFINISSRIQSKD